MKLDGHLHARRLFRSETSRFRSLLTTAAAALCLAPWGAGAQTVPGALSNEQLMAMVRDSVEQAAQSVMAAHPGVRVETQVGAFNPQLKLAPCQVAQPHINPGSRVWGDIRIGLRCVQGAVRWNVYVPATVRVYGPALVSTVALPSGHVLTDADLVLQEAEWSAEPGTAVNGSQAWVGRSLATGLKPGQALRSQHLRARQWFAAGQSVTLVARGPGFAVSSEGVAMTAGLEGQPTQVRLENGRMVQGMAVGSRRVEVNL